MSTSLISFFAGGKASASTMMNAVLLKPPNARVPGAHVTF